VHARNDLVASRANNRWINASRRRDLDSKFGRLPNLCEKVARLEHRLSGDAAPVEAGAADLRLLNQRDTLPELRRSEGGGVAARSAAEYEEIVVGHA
jgi:hypothetical protein